MYIYQTCNMDRMILMYLFFKKIILLPSKFVPSSMQTGENTFHVCYTQPDLSHSGLQPV